jgi:hypothetical protein
MMSFRDFLERKHSLNDISTILEWHTISVPLMVLEEYNSVI